MFKSKPINFVIYGQNSSSLQKKYIIIAHVEQIHNRMIFASNKSVLNNYQVTFSETKMYIKACQQDYCYEICDI